MEAALSKDEVVDAELVGHDALTAAAPAAAVAVDVVEASPAPATMPAPAPTPAPAPRPAPAPVKPRENVLDAPVVALCDDTVLALPMPRTALVRMVAAEAGEWPDQVDVVVAADPTLVSEAAHRAVPVVALESAETRRLVVVGGGFLVPADDVVAISDAINRIAALTPAGRRVMGRVAKQVVTHAT